MPEAFTIKGFISKRIDQRELIIQTLYYPADSSAIFRSNTKKTMDGETRELYSVLCRLSDDNPFSSLYGPGTLVETTGVMNETNGTKYYLIASIKTRITPENDNEAALCLSCCNVSSDYAEKAVHFIKQKKIPFPVMLHVIKEDGEKAIQLLSDNVLQPKNTGGPNGNQKKSNDNTRFSTNKTEGKVPKSKPKTKAKSNKKSHKTGIVLNIVIWLTVLYVASPFIVDSAADRLNAEAGTGSGNITVEKRTLEIGETIPNIIGGTTTADNIAAIQDGTIKAKSEGTCYVTTIVKEKTGRAGSCLPELITKWIEGGLRTFVITVVQPQQYDTEELTVDMPASSDPEMQDETNASEIQRDTQPSENSQSVSDTNAGSSSGTGADTATSIAYATRNLNVREGPGIDYDVITTIQGGSQITLLNESTDGWEKVQLQNGTEGWVSSKYIKKSENNAVTNETEYSSVFPNWARKAVENAKPYPSSAYNSEQLAVGETYTIDWLYHYKSPDRVVELSDPTVLSINSDGIATALKKGTCWVVIGISFNDMNEFAEANGLPVSDPSAEHIYQFVVS